MKSHKKVKDREREAVPYPQIHKIIEKEGENNGRF